MSRLRALALMLCIALFAAACGDDDTATDAGTDAETETTESDQGADEAAAEDATPEDTAAEGATADDEDGAATDDAAAEGAEKPVVEIPEGDAPTELVIEDLVEGTGAEATTGALVSVNYVGVLFKDGSEFDTSFGRGPFSVALGAGRVIPGWDEGLVGMKVGGRRQLTIPPDMAYGASGQGSIGPDETLVFVIDMLSVTTPATAADADIPAEAPAAITTTDLVEGEGDPIAAGQTGTFQYIVLGLDGTELDNSWVTGQVLTLELGTNQIPAEIEAELIGMTLGSRRQVVVPQGASEMTAEQDLVFLFDLTTIA
jgi:peptidylprolyl isomerase